MIRVDKSKVSTVIINAELMMYGYLTLRIDRDRTGVVASWFSVADGGDVISNNQKTYLDSDFSGFLDSILGIEIPSEEDEERSMTWSVQFGDQDGNLLYELENGTWDRSLLVQITDMIESILEDEEPLSDFRRLFDLA